MKIKSLCELIAVYNGIIDFFIDSGYGELQDLTPHPTLVHFVSSYSELNNLVLYWNTTGEVMCN